MKTIREYIGPAASLRGELMRGGIGTIAAMIGGRLLLIAVSIVLARLLGASGYGSYAFAMALVGLLAIPVQLGLPQFLIRNTAIFLLRNRLAEFMGLLIRANQIVFVFSAATAVAVAVAIHVFEPASLAAGPQTLLWAVPLVPLLGLSSLRGAALRGLRRVVLGQLSEVVLRPLIFLLLLGVALIFIPAERVTDTGTVQLQVVAHAIAFGIGTWLLFTALPAGTRTVQPAYDSARWLKSALPFLLLAGAQIIIGHTDTLMLGMLTSSADTGIYHVVLQIAAVVVFMLEAVNLVIAPHVARLHDAGRLQSLQRLVSAGATVALTGALPFVILLALFGRELLVFVFGDEFASGYTALWILSIGHFVNAAMGSVGLILNMTGYAWYSTAGVAVAALANVLLNALLIPHYGMIGAAVATTSSLIIWNLLLAWWVYRKTGLVSLAWWSARH